MATATLESRGMENTFSEVHGTMQLVSFKLGKELYGIEITKVREIILITEITRIPETPVFLKGLINLRSTVIPVIDLRVRFGLAEAEQTDESRIMVIQACGRTIGIMVDAVSEVLRVNHLASGRELEERVAQLLQRVGLRPEYMRRYPHAFSGGERQRIVIARALATNPRLIIADEAISALDVSIRAQILNLLEDLQDEMGLTYLFIAHDLSVIRHICDRVNVMYVGKLVESSEATALYTSPRHPYTEALMSAVPIHNPRQRDAQRRIRLEGDVADPSNPPSGCYFHPRCRYAQERCSVEEPALRPVAGAGQHYVACHFAEELTLRGVIAGEHPAAPVPRAAERLKE